MGSVSNLSVSQQITTLTFTGQSKFSDSYQQILAKAVHSDSITLSGLDDSRNISQGRLASIQSLDSTFSTLQQAVANLASSVGDQALAVSSQNSSLANYNLGPGALAGSYQLEVKDLGASTQSLSSSANLKVTDPNSQNIDSGATFHLSVTDPASNGGAAKVTTINNPAGTLTGLVNVINHSPSLGVQATIVNVGPTGSPDFRLALQSISLGAVTIGLSSADSPSLVNTTSTGHNASYTLNGVAVQGTSDNIEIAPGLTATLQQASPGNPTTVTVAPSTAQAANALQIFAAAYNAVVAQLATQHGSKAGILSGDSLLQTAQQSLSAINHFTSNGSGLNGLGLQLGLDGKLTFDSGAFQNGLAKDFSQVAKFIGNTTNGFVAQATSTLQGLEDASTGVLKTSEKHLTDSMKILDRKIADQISGINSFQNRLLETLARSDAAVYTISSQASFLQNMFIQMSANLTGGVA